MRAIRVIFCLSRYWRFYFLLLAASLLAFILIFIGQNDPQLEYYFPYFKGINSASEMRKLMDSNVLDYEFIYSNSKYCLGNIDNSKEEELDLRILLLSISQVNNFKARQAARKTWAKDLQKKNVKLLFFVGNSDFYQEPMTTPDGSLSKRRKEIFDNEAKLKKEIQDFSDIVQINMPDDDNFTSTKSLIALRWSHTYCSFVNYIFILNDNAVLNTKLFNEYLYKDSLFGLNSNGSSPKINDTIVAGSCNDSDPKLSNALKAFFKNIYQKKSPNGTKSLNNDLLVSQNYTGKYCSSLGWVLTPQAAEKLWITALNTPFMIRSLPFYISGYMIFKAKLSLDNRFNYSNLIRPDTNCLKIFQEKPDTLLCAENFTIQNRYNKYIATWNTDSNNQLVLSKLK